jgi:PUA domain protein
MVMSQKYRRYTLKTKESKQVLTQASEKLKMDVELLLGGKVDVETVEADFGELLLVDGKPVFFRSGTTIYPALTADTLVAKLPRAVVDMGAIKYVCNGADVMAPGIVRYEGEFAAGDLVVVVEMKYGKPLALGEALYSSAQARSLKQGPIIKSRHWVSDKVWNAAKTLTPS